MRLPRLFLDQPLEAGQRLILPPARARYLRDVLRLRPKSRLRLFNGRGGEFEAEVVESGRQVVVEVGPWHDREVESPLKITLALGIARGERMDFALQKATELGVQEIVPLLTERTLVRLDSNRLEKRMAHWRGVVISACEQCGRNRLPEIHPPKLLAIWLRESRGGMILFDPKGKPLPELHPPEAGALTLLIGPEGGLTPEEREGALKRGFQSAALGPRILRVETAVVAGITAVQLLWGDLCCRRSAFLTGSAKGSRPLGPSATLPAKESGRGTP